MGQTGEGYRADGACYTLNTIDRHAVCIQGSMVGRSDAAGPQGSGINDDVSFTLNTSDRHAVLCMTDTQPNAMVADGLCGTLSCHSKKDPPVVCMADDNAKAAIDEDLCGTLKVGGRTDHIRRRQTMTSYAIRMRSGKPGGQRSAGTERGERYVGYQQRPDDH